MNPINDPGPGGFRRKCQGEAPRQAVVMHRSLPVDDTSTGELSEAPRRLAQALKRKGHGMEDSKVVSAQSLRALDYLNVLLAHMREGVGPYLAIYLLTTQHWDPASIGAAISAMGIGTVLAQTPCGALIDTLRQKRLFIVFAALFVGVGCAAMTVFPTFDFVITVQALNGIAAAIFAPAV